MLNKEYEINDEYRQFLTRLVVDWSHSGKLYAITGCIKSESNNHKILWNNKRPDIIHLFNKFQRKITGARYWSKEKHRQVQVLVLPESASMLHYHGIICIPDYYFENSNIVHQELKEISIYFQYEELHKDIFKNSCKIEPIGSIGGWINYSTKEYDLNNTSFTMKDFMILPNK